MTTDSKVFFGDDDWDDIDLSDLVDEGDISEDSSDGTEGAAEDTATATQEEDNSESTEANPAEAEEESGAQAPVSTEPEASTDQYFDLKVLGQDRRLTRDEMIAAAQKGLDYDRIRSRYSDLQKEREANASSVELVKELADAQGIPVDQLITNVRAAALARKENISLEAATERVKIKAREDAVSKREAAFQQQDAAVQQEANERAARNRQFVSFFQNHPDVKPSDIPQQCFIDMKNGIPLEYSYGNQMASRQRSESAKALSAKDKRIKELEDQIASLGKKNNSQNQNQRNAARSVGSADTAGKASKDDAFDAAWYDGT